MSGERIQYELNETEKSTHPPILNAIEVYIIQDFSEPHTDELDGICVWYATPEYKLNIFVIDHEHVSTIISIDGEN